MASDPFGGGGGGKSSGGGDPFGGGGGGGGKKKSSKPNVNRQLVQAVSRLNRVKNPKKRPAAQQVIGEALQGYSGEQITRIGQQANISPGDIQAIVLASGVEHQRLTGADEVPLLNPVLGAADRVTARPIKAAVVEGQGLTNPLGAAKGLYHGSVEGKSYPGAQALIALGTGKSPEETAKIRQSLPAPVRVAGDFGGDVVFDWSNYLTLGAGALADNAARSVAKGVVGQAAEDAALSPAARAVYTQILAKGSKALTKEERKSLPHGIIRKLNRAMGGARVAGVPVPLTRGINRKLDELGVKPGGFGSGTEAAFRTRGELRQAERAGDVGRGVTQDVENIQAQVRGSEFMAGLGERRAQRGAQAAAGEALGKTSLSRAAVRAGRQVLDNPEALDRIRNSLDVGGGTAARAALPKGEREFADFLRGMSDEDFAALKKIGRLQNEGPTYYRATGAPRDEVIRETGRDWWDSHTFVADDPAKARLYGDDVTEMQFNAGSKILKQGTPEFKALDDAVRAANPGIEWRLGTYEHEEAIAKAAEAQGYDAVHFTDQGITGTIVLNPKSLGKTIPQDQYLFHAADRASQEGGIRRTVGASPSAGVPSRAPAPFLRARTNREAIGGVPGYEQNPVVSMGLHAKGTAREVGSVRAYDELQNLAAPNGNPLVVTSSHTVDDGLGGTIPRAQAIKADPKWRDTYDELSVPVMHEAGKTTNETVLVHKYVAPFFKKVIKSQADKGLRRNFEYLNALWAQWATATTGFISRNVLQGNLYMGMVLAEARDPRVWAKSLGTMRRMQRGITRLGDPFAFVKPEEKALVEGAIRDNAVESGFLDIIQKQYDESLSGLGKVSRGAKIAASAPTVPFRYTNQLAENWSRLSVYANKLKQGYSSPEAAAIARKYMLDYRDLSPVNEAARIVNPFLTWTYKSAPMILGVAARDPRKVKIPLALLDAVNAEGQRSEGTGVIPQWQIEEGGVTLPKGIRQQLPLGLNAEPQSFVPGTPIHTTLDALQPLVSAIELAKGKPGAGQDLGGDIINLLGPGGILGGGIKSAAEAAALTQFFSGRKFQRGQRVPTPGPLKPLLGDTMPWEVYNTISNLLPGMTRVATVAPSSPYEKQVQGRRIISQIGGLSVYPQGAGAARSEKYRRIEDINAFIRSLRDQGTKVPHRTRTQSSSGDPFG